MSNKLQINIKTFLVRIALFLLHFLFGSDVNSDEVLLPPIRSHPSSVLRSICNFEVIFLYEAHFVPIFTRHKRTNILNMYFDFQIHSRREMVWDSFLSCTPLHPMGIHMRTRSCILHKELTTHAVMEYKLSSLSSLDPLLCDICILLTIQPCVFCFSLHARKATGRGGG